MISQSWDGKRAYFTSSLLRNWDKKAADDEQYFKSYTWDGSKLNLEFEIDFRAEKLGSAHQMRFGAYGLYGMQRPFEKESAAKVSAESVEIANR